MENGTTILFGLPGVAVQRVERTRDEQGVAVRLVHVVTTASSAAGCPECGVVSVSVKQRRTTRPRDLPYGEEPLAVRWRKRQCRCREQACPRKAFTESITEIPARARLTGRLCRQAARQVASGRSVSAVAAELGVSWPVAHRHFAAHADAVLAEPGPAVVLGIDETRRGRPKWVTDDSGAWQRTERFETTFADLSGDGRLLGLARPVSRTSRRTWWPSASSRPATGRPISPVAPMTRMRPISPHSLGGWSAEPLCHMTADHVGDQLHRGERPEEDCQFPD